MLKVCTIGCGGHASSAHGPAQQRYAEAYPGTVLAGCCDLNALHAESYRERFGFERAYVDVTEMLMKERPDAVNVVVPIAVVGEVAGPLLRKGIPLMLEKPPGSTLMALEQLIAAAEIGCGMHHVAFNRRHMPVMQEARKILKSQMPPVFQIDYEMLRSNRRESDFSTTAIHAIDAALFLAGVPFVRASMHYRDFVDMGKGVSGVEVDIDCESGVRIRINIQPVAGRDVERIGIHCPNSSLELEFPVKGARGYAARLSQWNKDRELFSLQSGDATNDWRGFYEETEAFLNAVRSRESFGLHLVDCRQQVALMEAIRKRSRRIEWNGGSYSENADKIFMKEYEHYEKSV